MSHAQPAPLDPLIHQPTRLQIMGLLYRNRIASFTWVQSSLNLTAGNLDSHAAKLEAAGYTTRWRAVTPRGFQVHLRITPEGDAAFRRYLAALQSYLEATKRNDAQPDLLPPDEDAATGRA